MKRTLLALMMLAAAVPAWAQFETATVVGAVRDTSGAVCAKRQSIERCLWDHHLDLRPADHPVWAEGELLAGS